MSYVLCSSFCLEWRVTGGDCSGVDRGPRRALRLAARHISPCPTWYRTNPPSATSAPAGVRVWVSHRNLQVGTRTYCRRNAVIRDMGQPRHNLPILHGAARPPCRRGNPTPYRMVPRIIGPCPETTRLRMDAMLVKLRATLRAPGGTAHATVRFPRRIRLAKSRV